MFKCMRIGGNPNINEPIWCLGHTSARRHTRIHTFPCKGSSCFQLMLCLAPLRQTLGIGSSPRVEGLTALVLEQLLDLHPQLRKPGRGSAPLRLLPLVATGPAAPWGRWQGSAAAGYQHACRQRVWVGGKVCPGLLNTTASVGVRSNRNCPSRVLCSPAPSDRQQLNAGHCERWKDGASVLLHVSHQNEIPQRFSYDLTIAWVSYLVGAHCWEYRGVQSLLGAQRSFTCSQRRDEFVWTASSHKWFRAGVSHIFQYQFC